jgi:molybdopterin/thiamine biosynthesis adenylyltransferase
VGTAWSVSPAGCPCYRCLFEDLLPDDQAPNCSSAGVFGPMAGVVGALMADLALDVLLGVTDRAGQVFSIDGKRLSIRSTAIPARADCPLCGSAAPTAKITDISRHLYTTTGPLEARLQQCSIGSANSLPA